MSCSGSTLLSRHDGTKTKTQEGEQVSNINGSIRKKKNWRFKPEDQTTLAPENNSDAYVINGMHHQRSRFVKIVMDPDHASQKRLVQADFKMYSSTKKWLSYNHKKM